MTTRQKCIFLIYYRLSVQFSFPCLWSSQGSYGSWSSKRFSSTQHSRRTTVWSSFLRPSKISSILMRRFSHVNSWWVATVCSKRSPPLNPVTVMVANINLFTLILHTFNRSHLSTARMESVSGAGHRWEGNSPTHTEGFSSKHGGDLGVTWEGSSCSTLCCGIYLIYLAWFQDFC